MDRIAAYSKVTANLILSNPCATIQSLEHFYSWSAVGGIPNTIRVGNSGCQNCLSILSFPPLSNPVGIVILQVILTIKTQLGRIDFRHKSQVEEGSTSPFLLLLMPPLSVCVSGHSITLPSLAFPSIEEGPLAAMQLSTQYYPTFQLCPF